MDDEILRHMIEVYRDGGVSYPQKAELGPKRPEIGRFLEFVASYEGVPFRALWTFGGLEFCFDYQRYFEKIGVSGQTLAGCMDADTESIRSTCRTILASLDESRTRIEGGETHLVGRGLAINTAAVKAFILATLDAKERFHNDEIIPELYFLLSQVLFPGEPDVEAARASQNLKHASALLAWAYHFKHGIYPSYRKLSKILRVAPSTVSRLFETTDELESLAQLYSTILDNPSSHPYLKPIYPSL